MVKVGKCLCASYVLDCGTEKYLGSWKESHVSCYKVIGPPKVKCLLMTSCSNKDGYMDE